jgi:hypothetical protein
LYYRSVFWKNPRTDCTLFSNAQLLTAIDSVMARAERDEALRTELAGQLENIYNALSDSLLHDSFGALDAAINHHIALSDAVDSRANLLGALIAEYGKRMAHDHGRKEGVHRRLLPNAGKLWLHKLSKCSQNVNTYSKKTAQRRLGRNSGLFLFLEVNGLTQILSNVLTVPRLSLRRR